MKNTPENFQRLYDAADKAGREAATACTPTPMRVGVGEGANFRQTYPTVADGVCGFAWVKIKPATSSFCRWLKKNDLARKGYGPGLDIWISAYRQSMTLKAAYASAFARVLVGAGITAYSQSRMD